jgi:formyltetrahydrofolate hydrolase
MKDVIFLLFLSDHILDRSDLDEGPIIVQDVQPIDHQDSVEQWGTDHG